ncbi:MAG: hypothetical protein L3K06_02375, partial [Thermoplasmata archaeon]|nr:hypothetical protein [Thermoplasmata archaeon]
MASRERELTFGLPRMHKEPGERRDYLPPLVRTLTDLGLPVAAESGIGSAMGLCDDDYAAVSPLVRLVSSEEAFAQRVILTLRSPEGRYESLRPGATLIAMLHFPTRPARVRTLLALGIEAISLDGVTDDHGRRLVENCRAVAWNGLDAAFDALTATFPALTDPRRAPVRVTIMGAGAIGKLAVEAATKYGSLERDAAFAARGLPGVEVVTIGRNLTSRTDYLRERLRTTDVLVDATQRADPSRALVPNAWIASMPRHAVICDLVVDPYLLDVDPPTVRAIEGIPQGNLDRFVFAPDDPDWDQTVPREVPSAERRTVVTCYSWPGVHPMECMELYGVQLDPLLRTLVARRGMAGVRADGEFHERALWRASLRAW